MCYLAIETLIKNDEERPIPYSDTLLAAKNSVVEFDEPKKYRYNCKIYAAFYNGEKAFLLTYKDEEGRYSEDILSFEEGCKLITERLFVKLHSDTELKIASF